jgi:hypothetical protein
MGNLVGCVNDHAGLLDEWQAEDGVDSNIWTARDAQSGCVAFTSQIGKMELESYGELGGDEFAALLDDAAEGDGGVVGLTVDGGDSVGVVLSNRSKEVQIPG